MHFIGIAGSSTQKLATYVYVASSAYDILASYSYGYKMSMVTNYRHTNTRRDDLKVESDTFSVIINCIHYTYC